MTTISINKKSKVVAGLLAIFLGGFGIHEFYLGKVVLGAMYLIATVISLILCLFLIGIIPLILICAIAFIEGIVYLCSSDENFDKKYNQYSK